MGRPGKIKNENENGRNGRNGNKMGENEKWKILRKHGNTMGNKNETFFWPEVNTATW